MAADRRTSETKKPKPGEGDLTLHPDWFPSAWQRALPTYPSLFMALLLSTAVTRPVTGTIDEVVEEIFGDTFGDFLRELGDDLDSPLLWVVPREEEGEETEEEAEAERVLEERSAAERVACETALRAGGFRVPETLRELVGTMTALGIVEETEGRWTMPERLPLPEEVLDLPEPLRGAFRDIRRHDAAEPGRSALLDYLANRPGPVPGVFTTLSALARQTGVTIGQLRLAVKDMADDGRLSLYRGIPRAAVEVGDLEDHQRFHLVLEPDEDGSHFTYVVRVVGPR
ncbi:DUF6042 family protein [Streptomyces sp. NPDC056144]|uniref:DUF6042 family protein n=1 Tax=unclassified Streptomyces TaxID=2593676 RepID=UPI0035E2155D